MTDLSPALHLLRAIYVFVLLIVVWRLLGSGLRAFTSRIVQGDFDNMLFVGMSINRLWFIARGVTFNGPITDAWEAGSLAACYMFAIGLEVAVLRRKSWRSE